MVHGTPLSLPPLSLETTTRAHLSDNWCLWRNDLERMKGLTKAVWCDERVALW
jgi:hypothetical protein